MRCRGFSLIEVMLVTAIVSILLAIATLSFKDYYRRYRTEAQMRLIFSQLLKARVNAICQRRTIRVKLYPTRFEVYSTMQDQTSGVRPLQTFLLSYPVTLTNRFGDVLAEYRIDFKNVGITDDWGGICLESTAGSGAVDSITVYATRIRIGKKKD